MKGKQLLCCCEANIREEEWRPLGLAGPVIISKFSSKCSIWTISPIVKVGHQQWELCNLEPCPASSPATSITAARDLLCATAMASNASHQLQGKVGKSDNFNDGGGGGTDWLCSDTQLLFWLSRNQTNAASHPDQDLLNKTMIYRISTYNKAQAGAAENYHDKTT